MYAGIPCYNLKKLHKIIERDLPSPSTLFSASKEMRFTWEKQKINPDFEFDTIIPVSNDKNSKNNMDPLVISLGDLAPKSIIS